MSHRVQRRRAYSGNETVHQSPAGMQQYDDIVNEFNLKDSRLNMNSYLQRNHPR